MRFWVVLAVVCLSGCGKRGANSASTTKLEEAANRSDVAVITQSFDTVSLPLDVPATTTSEYGVESRWTAGYIRLTPTTFSAQDEPKAAAKGFVIEIAQSYWTVCCGPSHQPDSGDKASATVTLDEDQAKALTAELAVMVSQAERWTSAKPRPYTQIMFRAKGGFSVILNSAPVRYVIGAGAARVMLNAAEMAKLKTNLETGIRVLDSN